MSTDTVQRPQPLPENPTYPGNFAPDGRPFTWGPIQDIHSVGDIQVVEFLQDTSNHSAAQPEVWSEHGTSLFQPYLANRDTGASYHSLDSALVGAIARKRLGPDNKAAEYFDLVTLGVILDNQG